MGDCQPSTMSSEPSSRGLLVVGLLCLSCAGIMLSSILEPKMDVDAVLYENGGDAPVGTAGNRQLLYENGGDAPVGTAGNNYDDGNQDSSKYVYDPSLAGALDPADNLPDKEGQAPPVPHWHACRFQAKNGGVYDLRPMMRLAKTLEDDWVHQDALQGGTNYYLNICANTMVVPKACQKLNSLEPSPAYQVASNGNCYYLGTLKTFKWKPIDSLVPGKGMVLAYQNGERCGSGITRQVKYTISCSENFGYDDGPMVVYESRKGCHYDVHWPNKAGCPSEGGLLNSVSAGGWSTGGLLMLVASMVCCLYVAGGCFYRRKFEGAEGIEACPNHQLWCAIPAMFSSAGTAVYDTATGSNASSSGFQRVPAAPAAYNGSTYGASDNSGGIKDDMF